MKIQDVNNFFGDMDLFLMDLILKGDIKAEATVLDIGCGDGRNGIYFIRQGYEYHGWDTDISKLRLIEYLAKSIAISNAKFVEMDLRHAPVGKKFDLIICSRVLHFSESKEDFYLMWNKLFKLLNKGGVLYLSMDSVVDTNIGKKTDNELVEFPDGKIRFAFTSDLYEEIKKGFLEIEPLRTLVHHEERAQSFLCLKKI